MTEDTTTPAPSEPVAGPVQRPVRPLDAEPEAWLFYCYQPGRRMVFASIEPSGVESWPWDEWTHVERVALVPAGDRVTLWDKRAAGWKCGKCGTDRTKAACPKGHGAALTGECPMVAVAA
jgi:hypothetical protein